MKNVHIKINTHRVHLHRDFKDKAIAMGCEDYEIRSAQAGSSYHVLSFKDSLVEKPERRCLVTMFLECLESQVSVATPDKSYLSSRIPLVSDSFFNMALLYPPRRFDCRKNGVSLFTFTFLLILNEIDFSYILWSFLFFLFLTND